MNTLVWFRRDLRVNDNHALYHAAQQNHDQLIGLYVITPEQWQAHDDANCKVKFWMDCLQELSENLNRLNIPLRIETCDTFSDTPKLVSKFIKKHRCSQLFFNHEYEVNEAQRDQQVIADCERSDVKVESFHDRVIVPPRDISTQDGRFYSVFTPYRKVWDVHAKDHLEILPKPKPQPEGKLKPSKVPTKVAGFDFSEFRSDLWPAGEKEATKRLKKFVTKISPYDQARDLPSVAGTSTLSPYLAAGAISPRQCLSAAVAANQGRIRGSNEGATTWISELTWRDFYVHVLVGFPRVSRHTPFKIKTNKVAWRNDKDQFEAWKAGRTGYPIVDAGMRQLNRTGWMHNRLRMVTAMFLTKHLLIDWRLGEKYFMQKLIDGDLAANNGGWQWSASTGTDSVPYFRIFNPFSQSKRFDADGKFIKKLCPELEPIPKSALHDPTKLAIAIDELKIDYPSFIVDHKAARERALNAFKEIN